MHQNIKVFLEFFVFALAMGILEDLVAVGIVTGQPVTLETLFMVTLVAIPFAIFGEILATKYHLFQTGKRFSR